MPLDLLGLVEVVTRADGVEVEPQLPRNSSVCLRNQMNAHCWQFIEDSRMTGSPCLGCRLTGNLKLF